MKNISRCVCLLLLLNAANIAAAQNEADTGMQAAAEYDTAVYVTTDYLPAAYAIAEYLTAIYISGLRRTRLSAAKRPLQRFIGMEASQVNIDDVTAAIIATGILQPVSVEIEGQVLVVEVSERWSIFPIPMVMGGTGGMRGGLAFYDANAFGLNDQLFLATFFSSDGWVTAAGYVRSSRGGHLPGWNGVFSFSREERHDRDQNDNVLRRFNRDIISFNTGLSFPLIAYSNLLTASALFSFSDRRLRDHRDPLNAPDGNPRLFGFGGDFSVRRNNWDGFFLSQEAASVRYFSHTDFGGFHFHSVQFQGIWERPIIPGLRSNLRTGIAFAPQAPVLFESSPGVSQVVILPRDFSARNYAGVSASLEKSILRINAGTLSFSAGYQFVYSYGSVLGNSIDHGYIAIISFYITRLAIPALGLGIAHNVDKNYFQVFFSFGMSF